MIALALPLPISTNDRLGVYRGRKILSKEYREWIEHAGWELKRQKPGLITGPVQLELTIGKSPIDLSNHIKAVEDLLVTHKVIQDDGPKYVRRIVVGWDETIEGCRVEIKSVGE